MLPSGASPSGPRARAPSKSVQAFTSIPLASSTASPTRPWNCSTSITLHATRADHRSHPFIPAKACPGRGAARGSAPPGTYKPVDPGSAGRVSRRTASGKREPGCPDGAGHGRRVLRGRAHEIGRELAAEGGGGAWLLTRFAGT